jgi:hypothetical protein
MEHRNTFRKPAFFGQLLWRSISFVGFIWIRPERQQPPNSRTEIAMHRLVQRCSACIPHVNISTSFDQLLEDRIIVSPACHHQRGEADFVNGICGCARWQATEIQPG